MTVTTDSSNQIVIRLTQSEAANLAAVLEDANDGVPTTDTNQLELIEELGPLLDSEVEL
jgi:hypothetical protein